MVNIVFLSPHSDPLAKLGELDSGGQCVYEHQLALNLSKSENLKITTFCRLKYNYDEKTIVNENYSINRILCGPGRDFVPKEQMEAHLEEFTNKVIAQLDLNSEIVLYGHYWDGGAAAILVKKKLQAMNKTVSMLWTPHSLGVSKRRNFLGEENEKKFNFKNRINWENNILSESDKIIVSTKNEKDELINEYIVDKNKINIINPGVNHESISFVDKYFARNALGLPINKNILMTLGRMDKRKGYHNAIKAFAQLDSEKYKTTVLAIFSGGQNLSMEEESYLKELIDLADKLGVKDRVIFKKSVDYSEVHKVFFASDIYLCLSENEPFGLTVIESMNFGIPVIATNQGGPASIITNSINGFLVNSQDSKQIAFIAENLLNDQSKTKNIIKKASRLVKKVYAWNVKVKTFKKIILSTIPTNKLNFDKFNLSLYRNKVQNTNFTIENKYYMNS